jgi:hypothetical protein
LIDIDLLACAAGNQTSRRSPETVRSLGFGGFATFRIEIRGISTKESRPSREQ